MKITLRNSELVPATNFLQGMALKASDSRHRSKLVKRLVEAVNSLQESEKQLLEAYGKKDEQGNLIETEGRYDLIPEKAKEYQSEHKILLDEEVVIESGLFAKNFEEVPRILQKFDGELSGKDAEIYDRLLDEFEKEDAE